MNEFRSSNGRKYAVRQDNFVDAIASLAGYTLVSQQELASIQLADVVTKVASAIATSWSKRSARKATAKHDAELAALAHEARLAREAARLAREAARVAREAEQDALLARIADWEARRAARKDAA